MNGKGLSIIYELTNEAKRVKALQTITKYRADLIEAAVLYTKMLHSSLNETVKPDADESERAQATVTALIQYTITQQLKRAALVYTRTRLDVIMHCLWDLGGAGTASAAKLIAEFGQNLGKHEATFIRSYISIVCNYKGEYMELNVGGILRPPRELYVEVRVLKDCGEVVTCTGIVRLAENSQHYLKRSDVESLINAGYLKHIV